MSMKRITLGITTMAAAAILMCPPSQGHHAFVAEFDASKPVRVEGTIARVAWTNPHSWFFVDVKGADGQVQHWAFEGGGPYALIRRGFTKDYLKPGTKVVVEGFMSKGVPYRASAQSITYPDGRVLFVGTQGVGAPPVGAAKNPQEK